MAVIDPRSRGRRSSDSGSSSADRVSQIKEKIAAHAKQYFASTLGQERDIVNVIAAQYYLESSFNYNAIGPQLPAGNSGRNGYLTSSAVNKVLTQGTAQEKANINQGLFVIGLGQITGHYLIKGASKTGKCEMERIRPDLVSFLCIEPGEDLFATMLGEQNSSKMILACMAVLESKYKNVSQVPGTAYFKTNGDRSGNVYATKLAAAIAAYLGLGAKDVNGTTPAAYASSIIGGPIYEKANGKSPLIRDSVLNTTVAAGPSTNGANRAKVSTPGCG